MKKNSADRQALLSALYTPFRTTNSCPFKFTDLQHTVFGNGNPNSTIMFVGEAPGKDEDRLGMPFVGKSGQLLNRVLESTGTNRQEVFITNVVKWRPPNNRKPTLEEMEEGKKLMLNQEINIINPIIICTLGASALQALLGPEEKISQVRGKVFRLANTRILVLPTYHPAYILRNNKELENFMTDILKALKIARTTQ